MIFDPYCHGWCFLMMSTRHVMVVVSLWCSISNVMGHARYAVRSLIWCSIPNVMGYVSLWCSILSGVLTCDCFSCKGDINRRCGWLQERLEGHKRKCNCVSVCVPLSHPTSLPALIPMFIYKDRNRAPDFSPLPLTQSKRKEKPKVSIYLLKNIKLVNKYE